MDANLKLHQIILNRLGFDAGPADGEWGARTKKAVHDFQFVNGLTADGDLGPQTIGALTSVNATGPALQGRAIDRTPLAAPAKPPVGRAAQWPRQVDVPSFYGAPGNPKSTAGVCALPFPFVLAWDKATKVNSFRCHEKVAAAFTGIFGEAARHYGETRYRALGLDIFGGCYNLRAMRGGTAYSMHSWGIAVDLDPERNQLKWGKDRASFARPEYVPFWNIVEQAGATSLGRERDFDFQHFQFARL